MKKTEEKQEKKTLTRAEKKDAAKSLIKELLQAGAKKNLDIIEEAAKLFAERFKSEENENPNDVKGRIGSVLDVMKKEGEVAFDGGMVALKEQILPKIEEKTEEIKAEKTEKKPVAKKRASKKIEEKKEEKNEEKEVAVKEEVAVEEKPAKKPAAKKTAKKKETQAPQEIAEIAPQATEGVSEEKPTAKKRGKKAKIEQESVKKEEKAEEILEIAPQEINKEMPQEKTQEIKQEEKKEPVQVVQEDKKEDSKTSPQGTLMDMSFLLGNIKPQKQAKAEEKAQENKQEDKEQNPQKDNKEIPAKKQEDSGQVRVQEQKTEQKVEQGKRQKGQEKAKKQPLIEVKKPVKSLSAEEKLQEAFLHRLHRLGGEYFEYYSVYLLEKYSRMNGRRLESLRITAGERDGGIDGEIELTDKLGFRETIYIQAKNWDPSKGDEKLWVVGETLLQQFIGACVCRQAKEGKQHCRGIFITTSRFTPEAKKILSDTSDKFVGYDGVDLYETAKECAFGIVKKNGEWVLDEELLSGMKAFYSMQ